MGVFLCHKKGKILQNFKPRMTKKVVMKKKLVCKQIAIAAF
jgi:hypothetical protein